MIKNRRRAREIALQALYQCDTLGSFSPEQIELLFNTSLKEEMGQLVDNCDAKEYCKNLLGLILENLSIIDSTIAATSLHWSLERMARVDRNVLRLAVAEMVFMPEVPMSVSINEALEIVKRFGTRESTSFVNGVLDQISKTCQAA